MLSREVTSCRVLAAVVLIVATLGRAEPISAQGAAPQLVYRDATRAVGTIVWLVAADGSSKKPVGDMLGPGVRALDLRGSLLAVAEGNDLVNPQPRERRREPRVRRHSPRRAPTSRTAPPSSTQPIPSCGPVEQKTMIGEVNPATGAHRRWPTSTSGPALRSSGTTPTPTSSPLRRAAAIRAWARSGPSTPKPGEKTSSTPVEGCGWAAVSPTGSQALISYGVCMGPDSDAPELRAYGLPGGQAQEDSISTRTPPASSRSSTRQTARRRHSGWRWTAPTQTPWRRAAESGSSTRPP